MESERIHIEEELLNDELKEFVTYINGEPHIRHFLCWSYYPVNLLGKSVSNTMSNQSFTTKKKYYEVYFKKKKYNDILTLLDKHTQIEWFIEHYKIVYSDIGDKKYYKMLKEILVYIDNHDPYRKHYSDLISIGNDSTQMMTSNEKKRYNKLPQKLTIYRGTSSHKKITKSNVNELYGNSWSIDREISIWFGMNHSPKFRGSKYIILLTYELDKSEVVSYFTERGENEIFIDYTKIDLSRITIEEIPKKYICKVSFND